MKRLILAEPGLTSVTGHQHAHARVLAAECGLRGYAFQVLAAADASAAVLQNLPARKTFRFGVFDKSSSGSWFSVLAAFRTWSLQYKREFSDVLGNSEADSDLLLLNTVKIPVLAGFAAGLAGHKGDGPATAVMLRLPVDEGLPRGRLPAMSRWLYRRVLNNLHNRLGPRLLVATDARPIAEDFERLTGRQVAQMPLPISVPQPTPPQEGTGLVNLVFPSPARRRGFELLPAALASAFSHNHGLQATIRVPAQPRDLECAVTERLEEMVPRVRLVHGALDDTCFYRLLAEADAVLLTYDPTIFEKRSSQILAECAALGRPVIVIAGSFLDRECRDANIAHVRAEAFTAEALAAAIGRFVTDREQLAAAAWAAAPLHRQRHSVGAFVDRLVQFVASCGQPS